jgi:hypothetical protein
MSTPSVFPLPLFSLPQRGQLLRPKRHQDVWALPQQPNIRENVSLPRSTQKQRNFQGSAVASGPNEQGSDELEHHAGEQWSGRDEHLRK